MPSGIGATLIDVTSAQRCHLEFEYIIELRYRFMQRYDGRLLKYNEPLFIKISVSI